MPGRGATTGTRTRRHERERPMRRDPMDLIYLLGMFGPVIVLLVILLAH
ncbi:hypothetical protein [Kitasatospora sp. NBC_01302]|nr:hypothetical protein OG294_40030 [Kitasatospora sp. NBC_01302]